MANRVSFWAMKAIGIIPARYASSRFPGKPLASILGKTLIQRTYENACKTKELEEIVIATDDARIFEHAESFGAPVVMTSVHCPTGTDRVNEVLQKEKKYAAAEIVVNIQGDEPCLDPHVIDQLVVVLRADPSAVVATPIAKIHSRKRPKIAPFLNVSKMTIMTPYTLAAR